MQPLFSGCQDRCQLARNQFDPKCTALLATRSPALISRSNISYSGDAFETIVVSLARCKLKPCTRRDGVLARSGFTSAADGTKKARRKDANAKQSRQSTATAMGISRLSTQKQFFLRCSLPFPFFWCAVRRQIIWR